MVEVGRGLLQIGSVDRPRRRKRFGGVAAAAVGVQLSSLGGGWWHSRQAGVMGAGWTVSKGSSSGDARRTGRLPSLALPACPTQCGREFNDHLAEWSRWEDWMRVRRRVDGKQARAVSVQLRSPYGRWWHSWQKGLMGVGWAVSKGSSSGDARRTGCLPSLALQTRLVGDHTPRRG